MLGVRRAHETGCERFFATDLSYDLHLEMWNVRQ